MELIYLPKMVKTQYLGESRYMRHLDVCYKTTKANLTKFIKRIAYEHRILDCTGYVMIENEITYFFFLLRSGYHFD